MTRRIIVTVYDAPPIPFRGVDWHAIYEGTEETGPYGRGATEDEAIANLIELSEDN